MNRAIIVVGLLLAVVGCNDRVKPPEPVDIEKVKAEARAEGRAEGWSAGYAEGRAVSDSQERKEEPQKVKAEERPPIEFNLKDFDDNAAAAALKFSDRVIRFSCKWERSPYCRTGQDKEGKFYLFFSSEDVTNGVPSQHKGIMLVFTKPEQLAKFKEGDTVTLNVKYRKFIKYDTSGQVVLDALE